MSTEPLLGVAAVVVDDERLLLVRRGSGPAGGWWDLPGARIAARQTIAEAVVEAVASETGLEAVTGELVGVEERLDGARHEILLVVHAGLIDDVAPVAGGDAAEARWHDVADLGATRFAPGLAEFLHDHGVLSLLT